MTNLFMNVHNLTTQYNAYFQDGKNLVYAELVLKQSDEPEAKISKNTTEYAEIVYKPNADKPTEEPKK